VRIKEKDQDTKTRLLHAAGDLFATKGFKGATIRDICDRVGANLASVHYYFRDKEGLYEAVVQYVMDETGRKFPHRPFQGVGDDPAEELFLFIKYFLERRLHSEFPDWFKRVLFQALHDPRPSIRELVTQRHKKNYVYLVALIRRLLPESADDRTVHLVMASVIGQCQFYQLDRYLVPELKKHVDTSPEGIEQLARYITDFLLGAIRSFQPAEVKL